MTPNIELPYNFKPRKYQEPFFKYMNGRGKRAVLVHHRRAGKDICSWNFMIYSAFERVGIYYYIFPTYSQGKKVLWDGMTKEGFKFINYIPKELIEGKPNSTEMKIKLTNGSLIQVIGSDNYDSIMGTNPTGCVFSEYSLQDPNAWQFVRPILDANPDSWAIFVFTPRGANHAKDLYDMAKKDHNWFCQTLTVEDTGVVSQEIIEKARAEGMSEDMIQQEYFCSFNQGIVGAYYVKYLKEARDDRRIGHVPYDTQLRVNTAWDLGINDSTAIVFFQLHGKEIRIIDYYENSGEGLPHYAKVIFDKPYIYDTHYAPHDIAARDLSHGLSRHQVAANLGLNFTILKTLKLGKMEAIEGVRGRFNRFWIDETKCERLIKCLENYRKVWNEKMQIFYEQPLHNWASHGADAVSYMCFAIKQRVDNQTIGIDDEEAERMMHRYRPY
jgi:hypothetical protein